MKKYRFVVGDVPFDCILPDSVRVSKLLPSFGPFYQPKPKSEADFVVETVSEVMPDVEWQLLETFQNDMGLVNLYRYEELFFVKLGYEEGTDNHLLWMNLEADKAYVMVDWDSPYAGQALTSMLRIIYSQRVLFRNGFSIHASTVVKDGSAYMFLGKSGTGKSTHSRLWKQVWSEVELLNDDNPIVRIVDGRVWVYGSPWSGKTPCYKQAKAPLKGVVRLAQAPENRLQRVKGVKAWTTLYPSCAVIAEEPCLYELLQDTLNRVVVQVAVAQMDCRPDEAAARLSEEKLK